MNWPRVAAVVAGVIGLFLWGSTVLGIAITMADKGSELWWLVLVFGLMPVMGVIFVAPRMLHGRRVDRVLETSPAPVEPRTGLVEDLTPREREVLALIAQGRTNRQIATDLYVSPATVKSHVNAICRKLGADNRTHAVARARELGLL